MTDKHLPSFLAMYLPELLFLDLGNLLSMPWFPIQCDLCLEIKFHCRGANGYTYRIIWLLNTPHHLDAGLLCVEMMLLCTTTLYEIVVMFSIT